jgi:hypothetical protein
LPSQDSTGLFCALGESLATFAFKGFFRAARPAILYRRADYRADVHKLCVVENRFLILSTPSASYPRLQKGTASPSSIALRSLAISLARHGLCHRL